MEYSREYLVHYYEIDRKRRLTLPALIRYFEDIATLDSEARGFTLDYYDRSGHGFMLLKWDIAVHSWPGFNETVKITTRPSAYRRFLANRGYVVRGNDGRVLADARSVWLYADTGTRRPARVPDELYAGFGVARESSFDMLEDLHPTVEGLCRLGIKVQPGDIDMYRHVNNVRYVEWALESLPEEIPRDHAASRIQVNYMKELKMGDEAEVVSEIYRQDGGQLSAHSIYNGDNEVCRLRLEWLHDLRNNDTVENLL
jgi:medium-chain acyl-[acyl-carrier-protein] hydrolase